MNNTRDIVYLAALLHDIGKFYQRADTSYQRSSKLSKYPHTVKNADNICPTSQEGYFKYQHVIWTQLFFEENKTTFEKLGLGNSSSFDNFVNLSIYHHKPQSRLQAFIQYADWWASGIDRTEYYSDEEKVSRGKLKFKEEPLLSIFGNLTVDQSDSSSEKIAFNLKPLDLSEEIFPSKQSYIDGLSEKIYADHWELFSVEFKELSTDSLQVFTGSLHYLLKKYCWCIPASTIDFADNSLFDHLKITAAIAQCMIDYDTEFQEAFEYNRRISLQSGHLPLLLLCVDLSGIQKFIYNISSKYASKSLKGRSFSLQLMLDEIAGEIIRKTDSTLSHIIYSSGGKFFMLLPNTTKIIDALKNIEKEIQKVVWKKYRGNLYICMGYEAFAYNLNKKNLLFKDGTGTLGDLWKKVTEKIAEKKHRKFNDLLTNDYGHFFEASDSGGLTDICSVTGEEVEEGHLSKIDEEVKISPEIKEQIEIGEDLANHDFIVYSTQKQHNLHGHRVFKPLTGRNFQFLNRKDLCPTENAEICTTVKNEINFLSVVASKNTVFSYRFYGGSDSAKDDKNQVLSFENLSGSVAWSGGPKNERNFNRLGVLRMDVDNLGQLFIRGFKPQNASFSAYATLSGQLDWFFSGYLNTLRNKPDYQDTVNIIYSGGDDVFAVGRWDAAIRFADEIQQSFRKFTGREDITLSAGIVIVPDRYPIAKAADMAGEGEDAAKAFRRERDGKQKNAISLFGITIGWEEFETVKSIKQFWIQNLSGDKPVLSRGILQRMFDYYRIFDEREENDPAQRKLNLSWRWHAAYALKRQESKKDPAKTATLKTLEMMLFLNLFSGEQVRFEAFIVACRWAELELKDNKKI